MTHPDPFTSNTAMDKIMDEVKTKVKFPRLVGDYDGNPIYELESGQQVIVKQGAGACYPVGITNDKGDGIMSDDRKADEGGGPEMYAFPSYTEGVNSFGVAYPIHETGMTLRDYFAAQVIHLTMENDPSYSELRALFGNDYGSVPFSKVAATRAYLIADAMLEARKVKP